MLTLSWKIKFPSMAGKLMASPHFPTPPMTKECFRKEQNCTSEELSQISLRMPWKCDAFTEKIIWCWFMVSHSLFVFRHWIRFTEMKLSTFNIHRSICNFSSKLSQPHFCLGMRILRGTFADLLFQVFQYLLILVSLIVN